LPCFYYRPVALELTEIVFHFQFIIKLTKEIGKVEDLVSAAREVWFGGQVVFLNALGSSDPASQQQATP
jgi:hypothetical protein